MWSVKKLLHWVPINPIRVLINRIFFIHCFEVYFPKNTLNFSKHIMHLRDLNSYFCSKNGLSYYVGSNLHFILDQNIEAIFCRNKIFLNKDVNIHKCRSSLKTRFCRRMDVCNYRVASLKNTYIFKTYMKRGISFD